MTSIVIWAGADSHGPSSLYMAADSRITWGSNNSTWDQGRKTFASRRFPDVACFLGDVLFPLTAIAQFFEVLDSGLICLDDSASEERFRAFEGRIRISLDSMSADRREAFTIFYGSRDGSLMKSTFRCWAVSWRKEAGEWTRVDLTIPSDSDVVRVDGSGKDHIERHIAQWRASSEGGTSRAVFSAFCDSLRLGQDRRSGGGPQLVGLYRKGTARSFGVVLDGRRFIAGVPVTWDVQPSEIEWRNELFERADPETRRRMPGAQRHPRPE